MSNLTITSYYTRRTLFWSVVAVIGFLVVKGSLYTAAEIWRKLNPPPPPAPEQRFGPLPPLSFPAPKTTLPEKITYKLETIEGTLPKLLTVAPVYFSPKVEPNILSLQRATQKAATMGFPGKPEAIDKSRYRWKTITSPNSVLEMDIETGNFQIRYPYETDTQLLAAKNTPSDIQAAQEAKGFLSTNGYLPEELEQGSAEFAYLRYNPPVFTPASSLSEADFVRVNFFRANLNDLRIMPPDPKLSLITFLFSGSREAKKRMVEINYTYHKLDKDNNSTYPLKTSDQAWQELQAGKGYIANLGQNTDGNIVIRHISLGYYDSDTEQTFFQPIFIFEGDRDFYAYVPAIGSQL